MATLHADATNLVPTISSGTLPDTPADEWAGGMNEFIGTHVTRTPVGTPGPDVPGAFPAHLEPDSSPSHPSPGAGITAARAQEQASALLASAQAYLPSLETAKAYLPQGVAAYLPSTGSDSSLPALPASTSSVDVGHGATVPYTESAPEPYRQDTTSSSTVDVGHGASVPYTESAPEPYSQARKSPTPTRDSTALSTTAHTGHAASPTGIPPPAPASGLLPSHPAAPSGPLDTPTPSPSLAASHPSSSFSSASGAGLTASPLPGAVGVSAGGPSERPTPTPDLLPSHPAAGPAPHVHAYPTHTLALAVHPTPHAVSSSATSVADGGASTPGGVSTVSTPGGASGYTASSESGLGTPTPSSASLASSLPSPSAPSAPPPPPKETLTSTFPPFVGAIGPGLGLGNTPAGGAGAHAGGVQGGVQGSAALNSARRADMVPTGDFDSSPHHPAHSSSTAAQGGRQGHGHGLAETHVLPTGDPPSTECNTASAAPGSSDADAEGEDSASGSGSGSGNEGKGGEKKGKKGRKGKGKLLQRLKEKMHVA
ncbi:hypothetical protein C8F04DRAFT_1306130 [Mycena alexandri]|uniref:Uncharacterized protein n=1 Tax=Mycena alexandri TaxID=1745969 RepID=A0AAD6WQ92_9AGAR|nr:hypothetical protein C8F04DRAFT_1306130 [Mycena alexandri]